MSKIQYMITEEYVRDWQVQHALREIIANGVDAEVALNAPLNVIHNPRTKVLVVRNDRTRLDVKALYFGGTTKAGNTTMVGQYGEGLKLALLVLARNNIPVKIHNDDEDWSAKIEADANGVRVLTIYTRKASQPTGSVEVEIGGIDFDLWDDVRSMFLRLLPPQTSVKTAHGTILFDADRVGKYYARGVFISRQTNAAFGYDFTDLNVGRDRLSFSSEQADGGIHRMWSEAVSRAEDVVAPLFEALKADAQDLTGFSWMINDALSEKLVAYFKSVYGDDAYPVQATSECEPLAFLQLRGVVLPRPLVMSLRRKLPPIETLRWDKSREVQERFSLEALDPVERKNYLDALELLKAIGLDLASRTVVVRFGDDSTLGVFTLTETRLSRKVLRDWGATLVTMIHEAAHVAAGDGTYRHHATEEAITERVFNHLRRQQGAGEG